MISEHKKKGHGAHLITPNSNLHCHIAGGLIVDDTDLFHLDMRGVESAVEVHKRLQDAAINGASSLSQQVGR
jgi:hypothetical protein